MMLWGTGEVPPDHMPEVTFVHGVLLSAGIFGPASSSGTAHWLSPLLDLTLVLYVGPDYE